MQIAITTMYLYLHWDLIIVFVRSTHTWLVLWNVNKFCSIHLAYLDKCEK
jgi:hypothetical protein